MKALATNPADRYRTVDELRVALDKFMTSIGVRTSPSGIADYMKKLFGHRPEPWLVETTLVEPLSKDFDGSASGVVVPPEAAVQRFALPRRIGPTSPIVLAHNDLTGQSYTPPPMNAAANRIAPHG